MIRDIRDTRRAHVSTSKLSLGFQTSIYALAPPWKAQALEDETDLKGTVDVTKIKRKRLLRYNALDSAYTAIVDGCQMREELRDKEDLPRVRRLRAQQERLAKVGAQMALDGFPIDQKRRRDLSEQMTKLAAERARKFYKLTDKYGHIRIKFGASWDGNSAKEPGGGVNQKDFAALIWAESKKPNIKSFNLEVPFTEVCRTDSGKPSVDQASLLYLFAMDNTPEVLKQIIYAYWQVNAPLKARNTFLDSKWVLDRIGPDGRMHASINTAGAETGRWTCSRPNLFNLSETKKEEEGWLGGDLPNIRDIYVAPKGYVIVHRDFKSFEVEVLEHVTQDVNLRLMLDSEEGPHNARARRFFADIIPADQPVPKGIKRQAKVVGLACQYHAGEEAVFMQVLKQIQDARREEIAQMWSMFPEIHPGIAQHWAETLEFAETHGHNETCIMQRRRFYPPGFHLKDTETSNYDVQGTAADIANSAMVGINKEDAKHFMFARLRREHPRAWLAMHTYDSFDVICPEREATKVDRLMDECMQGLPYGGWKVKGQRRKYKSDGKIGKRWSEV